MEMGFDVYNEGNANFLLTNQITTNSAFRLEEREEEERYISHLQRLVRAVIAVWGLLFKADIDFDCENLSPHRR